MNYLGFLRVYFHSLSLLDCQGSPENDFFFKIFNIICIYLLIAVLGLGYFAGFFSSCGSQELLSGCDVQAPQCRVFSCCRAWALDMQASEVLADTLSSCSSQALGHRLRSCGTQAELHGFWDLQRAGIKLESPALADGLFTTEPPRKPQRMIFKSRHQDWSSL